MDHELYQAVRTGQIRTLQNLAKSNLTVLRWVTTQKDNILHVAAKYDQNQMAEEIVKLLPSLVNQKNSKGDTPLHVAARLGSLKTAQTLINYAKNTSREIEAGNERLTRMVNMEKDTALHDAARNGHLQIAKLLIKEDPELSCLTNNVGESPLFVAVDKKYVDIAKHIIEVAPAFSVDGRNNMNALHAAVVRSGYEVIRLLHYLRKIRRFVNSVIPTKDFMKCYLYIARPNTSYEELIECLTKTRQSAISQTDEYEWTPLHYAVHFGRVGIVELFLKCIDSPTAYIKDKEGMSVIHIAAREGEVIILKKLADRFPEIWDLQNNKGQTALHLAVANGKLDCVKFILKAALSHDGFLNQQDNQGNTALHLTALQGDHGKIFKLLIKDKRVDKAAINMEGLTVLDILLFEECGYFEKVWTLMAVASNGGKQSLEHTINQNGRKTRSTETRKLEQTQQLERRKPTTDTQEEGQQRLAIRKAEPLGLKNASYEQLQNIASTHLLVTTIIATVSFAAGFTIPGGYKSNGPDEGMAILSRKCAIWIFVIANTIAFSFSTTSMIFHCYMPFIEKLDVLSFYRSITTVLTSWATTAMVIAFLSGSHAVLADSPGLDKAVLSIGCSLFGIEFLIYLKY